MPMMAILERIPSSLHQTTVQANGAICFVALTQSDTGAKLSRENTAAQETALTHHKLHH